MVFLKYIVIGVPYPGEGTQNRNDDEDVGDDATGEHRWVLDGTIPNYVDDLVDQPSIQGQKNILVSERIFLRSTRECAAGMNTPYMLENRCRPIFDRKRSPL